MTTEPVSEMRVKAGSKVDITCTAEGNPQPRYEWIQRGTDKISDYQHLVIEKVGYSQQGEYICTAINTIGGKDRSVRSEVVRLDVTGVPQVLTRSGDMIGVVGEDVSIEGVYCSDPAPIRTTWEWDGTVLPTGSDISGRFRAESVPHPSMEECYISSLVVSEVEKEDAMTYSLHVENSFGQDQVLLALHVEGIHC